MIWRPKKGMIVRLRYRKALRDLIGLHDRIGRIEIAASGPGPLNSLIRFPGFDGDIRVVVPRGNLFPVKINKDK
jgi:hypothetical protein